MPIISKTLERCVLNKIFFNLSLKLDPSQHGFTKGKSTVTQLLDVYNKISRTLDMSGQTDVIYLDFSKAFDSVDHKLLIWKLKQFGIGGELIKWLQDYLTNRVQQVVINGQVSSKLPVLSGVPQGSILGPTLFLMYINDLAQGLMKGNSLAMFADDAKIFRQINSVYDCSILQLELNRVTKWSHDWRMNFNVGKCQFMSITRKINPHKFQYSMNNLAISRVTEFRDLGVIITDNMTWDKHVGTITKKANRNLWLIKRTLGYLAPTKAKKLLYVSLVRSILEYASQLWNPSGIKNIKIIESIQRRATKYILNISYPINIPYISRLAQTNLMPLSYRREILDLNFIHQGINGKFGMVFTNMFPYRLYRRATRLSGEKNMLKPSYATTETYRQYFSQRANVIWNRLPSNIRAIPYDEDSKFFKNMLVTHYTLKLYNTFDVVDMCTWFGFCRCQQAD